MMHKPVLVASDARVEEAGAKIFPKGNAIDAVVAGLFAAAALDPSVLLGSVQLVVGGTGTGLWAFDGRLRQPGRDIPRPRGFMSEAEVPRAARVAVPLFAATLMAAHAKSGSITWAQALAPALGLIEKRQPRGALLRRVAERGATAMGQGSFAEELLHVAGRIEGGLVSQPDLDKAMPVVERCAVIHRGALDVAAPSWAKPSKGQPVVRLGLVAAGDAHGSLVAAVYEMHEDGVLLEEHDLRAPLRAHPVMRGQPRTRPGEAIDAPVPLALLAERGGAAHVVVGGFGTDAESACEEALARWTADGVAFDAPPGHVLAVVRGAHDLRSVRGA